MNNKKIIIFILNFFGCALVFMSLTSYFPSTGFLEKTLDYTNPYRIQFSGELNSQIDGIMRFTSTVERSDHGISYTTLNLELENNTENKFAIIISNENENQPFKVGTYKVLREKQEEFTKINGVFGYLNRVKSQELPFYIEKGKVKITKIDKKIATGYIDLKLEDYNGRAIDVQGDFIASNINN